MIWLKCVLSSKIFKANHPKFWKENGYRRVANSWQFLTFKSCISVTQDGMPFSKAFNLGGCCSGYAQGPEQQHCHWKDQAANPYALNIVIEPVENKAMALVCTVWCIIVSCWWRVNTILFEGLWYDNSIYEDYEICSCKFRTH